MTRLRLDSHLREQKFKHSFQDSINPLNCCYEVECTVHFLLPFVHKQKKHSL